MGYRLVVSICLVPRQFWEVTYMEGGNSKVTPTRSPNILPLDTETIFLCSSLTILKGRVGSELLSSSRYKFSLDGYLTPPWAAGGEESEGQSD